jgi:hypothetical protein
MSMDPELARRHTSEDYQVDPIAVDSEDSSLYDDDEKQLVVSLLNYSIQRQADFLPS